VLADFLAPSEVPDGIGERDRLRPCVDAILDFSEDDRFKRTLRAEFPFSVTENDGPQVAEKTFLALGERERPPQITGPGSDVPAFERDRFPCDGDRLRWFPVALSNAVANNLSTSAAVAQSSGAALFARDAAVGAGSLELFCEVLMDAAAVASTCCCAVVDVPLTLMNDSVQQVPECSVHMHDCEK
jgi:hypothetical protein